MTSPIDFLGEIPELKGRLRPVSLNGEPVSALPLAHMVDGEPAMHALAGIGGYRVCDYFLPTRGGAVMIEHSFLLREMSNMRERGQSESAARELLAREYCLKAYGSMLTLYRLFFKRGAKSADELSALSGLRGEFWVVISDAKTPDMERKSVIAFQFLKGELDKRARPLFHKTKVLGRGMLKDELKKQAQSEGKKG